MTAFDRIKKVLMEEHSIPEEKITLDTSLIDDLNFDSLDAVELIMAIEKEFECEIADEDIESLSTVRDAVELAKRKGAE